MTKKLSKKEFVKDLLSSYREGAFSFTDSLSKYKKDKTGMVLLSDKATKEREEKFALDYGGIESVKEVAYINAGYLGVKYPLYYNGELWFEDEVCPMFSANYKGEMSLGPNMEVYCWGGMNVRPDGTLVD